MQFHTTKCLRQALLSNATTISVSTLNARYQTLQRLYILFSSRGGQNDRDMYLLIGQTVLGKFAVNKFAVGKLASGIFA